MNAWKSVIAAVDRLVARMHSVQDKLPAPSVRVQRWAMIGWQSGIALMGIISMHPYFLWSQQKPAYALATLLLILSCGGCFRALVLTRERILLSVAASLFLVYLSLLPKVHGGITRWLFLIPFVLALLLLSRQDLQRAFNKFQWLFAVSLLPGMLAWLWLAAGLPMTFEWTYPPSEIVQRGPTPYFMRPGVIFLPTNGMLLPNGGTIFRLCGVYDEPGTVGTIAALTLAATRYRLDWKGAVCFVAGVMSLSIAFAVLTVIGLLATAAVERRFGLLAFGLVSALAGAVPALGLEPKISDPNRLTSINLILPPSHPHWRETQAAGRPFGLFDDAQIRQSQVLDNRALPAMRKLFNEYAGSGPRTLLFGIASNASNIHAGDSASWLQILTNYGIVGFAWLFVLFAAPMVWLWRRQQLDFLAAMFCLLFLMSFYQRPVIWLPVPLLIYLAGLSISRKTA
jgi:hypothetical protein